MVLRLGGRFNSLDLGVYPVMLAFCTSQGQPAARGRGPVREPTPVVSCYLTFKHLASAFIYPRFMRRRMHLYAESLDKLYSFQEKHTGHQDFDCCYAS